MIQEETPAVPENKKEISIKRVCLGKVSCKLELRFREWDWLIIKGKLRLASLVKLHFTATNVHLRLLLTFNQPPFFLLSLKKRKNKQEQEPELEEERPLYRLTTSHSFH